MSRLLFVARMSSDMRVGSERPDTLRSSADYALSPVFDQHAAQGGLVKVDWPGNSVRHHRP